MENDTKSKRPAALTDPKKIFYYKDQKVYACQSGSTTWKPATINEIKLRESHSDEEAVLDPSCYLYYVHFMDQNRRMDEWLTSEQILGPMREVGQTSLIAPDPSLLMSPQMTTRGRQTSFGAELATGKSQERDQSIDSETDDSPAPDTKRAKIEEKPSTFLSKSDIENRMPLRKDKVMRKDGSSGRIPFDHRPKNISRVHFGIWWLEPWYYSPFPCMLDQAHIDRSIFIEKSLLRQFPLNKQSKCNSAKEKVTQAILALSHIKDLQDSNRAPVISMKLPELFVCEFCLESFPTRTELTLCHQSICTYQYPPGTEIYRDVTNQILVFEIDAVQQRHYCERLCLLSRLFLEHKCVDYDIRPFVFYVVTFYDNTGCHLLGYFSKEKVPQENNNLSCITVLPPYQSRGIGRFLIDLCYELSKRVSIIGTPERPLSDLGARSYNSYWRDKILDCVFTALANDRMEISLDYIIQQTGIALKDIVETLVNINVMEKGSWDALCKAPKSGKSLRLFLPEELRQEHYRRKTQKENQRQMEQQKQSHPPTLQSLEKVAFPQFNRFLLCWDASTYILQ